MIGKTVAQYKIIDKVDEGGMGVVYKAVDTRLKRTVALKFLPTRLTGDPRAKERFKKEAEAAAALNHANVITVYDVDQQGEQVYIAMEYVEGENLLKKLQSGALELDKLLYIAIQAAQGLQEAHEKGIVHRDIKSANIMIDGKNRAKIMDFGLARLNGGSHLTKEGTTVGTAAYMSPEQAQGGKTDHRSDIWSFGVVLFQMATGRLPFNGENEQAVIYSILNNQPEKVSTLQPGLPGELVEVIDKALSKSPAQRYQETGQLLTDLKAIGKQEPFSSGSASDKAAALPFKLPSLSLVTAALSILLVVVLYFVVPSGEEAKSSGPVTVEAKPSLAVVYFENNTGDPSLDNWRNALPDMLTSDLSQSSYLKVLRSDEMYGIVSKLDLLNAPRYSLQNLKSIAGAGKVTYILKGSYIKAGDQFLVTAVLIDALTGSTVKTFSVKARAEQDLFSEVDNLTKEIKEALEIPSNRIATDFDKDISSIITSYPAALKLYTRGRQLHLKNQTKESIELMEKAIAIDPGFALAYRSMAWAYGSLGEKAKNKEFLRMAVELSSRLPDRELYLIRGDYYSLSEETKGKAIKAYKTVQRLYPDDYSANNNLAVIYLDRGEWDKAIEQLKIYREVNDPGVISYTNLAYAYASNGNYQKALEVMMEFKSKYMTSLDVEKGIALIHIGRGNFQKAMPYIHDMQPMIQKKNEFDEEIWFPGDILFFSGRLKEAEQEFKKYETHTSPKARWGLLRRWINIDLVKGNLKTAITRGGRLMEMAALQKKHDWISRVNSGRYLASLYFKSKQYNKALQQFKKMETDVDTYGYKYKGFYAREAFLGQGLSYLRLGNVPQAEKIAEEIRRISRDNYSRKHRFNAYYFLSGAIEFHKKRYQSALEHLEKANPLIANYLSNYYISHSHTLLLDYIARTYLGLSNLEAALRTYGNLNKLTVTRVEDGDLHSLSYYRTAKVLQKLGRNKEAEKYFQSFSRLWKDCDPSLKHMVRDAAEQSARLGNSETGTGSL